MNKENSHKELLVEIKEENYISQLDSNGKMKHIVEETPSKIKNS